MIEYTANNTLRIAKRQKNSKRTYLLVNPLQAKHIPASPSESLSMMRSLGKRLAGKYPDTTLVIGFAETATAIGAAVAECFGTDCVYIHTTREDISGVDWLYFLEEHSHAVEQKICGNDIQTWAKNTSHIIFVDDELSTGKTLINMVEQLRCQFPELGTTRMVAASILNRLTPENIRRLTDVGIQCEYLVKLPETDYTEQVSTIKTIPAEEIIYDHCSSPCYQELSLPEPLLNPRLGVNMSRYADSCKRNGAAIADQLFEQLQECRKLLVLGTEECMYPALTIAEEIERRGGCGSVRCHATTRSPIGICSADGYPITNGCKLHSFYDAQRETYLYDLERYDAVIVVSDAHMTNSCAIRDIAAAFEKYGDSRFFLVRGDCNV